MESIKRYLELEMSCILAGVRLECGRKYTEKELIDLRNLAIQYKENKTEETDMYDWYSLEPGEEELTEATLRMRLNK